MGVSRSWQEHITPDSVLQVIFFALGGQWTTNAVTKLGSTWLRITCNGWAHVNRAMEKSKCQFQLIFNISWVFFAWYSFRGPVEVLDLSAIWNGVQVLGYCAAEEGLQEGLLRHCEVSHLPYLCPCTPRLYLAFASCPEAVTGAMENPRPSLAS